MRVYSPFNSLFVRNLPALWTLTAVHLLSFAIKSGTLWGANLAHWLEQATHMPRFESAPMTPTVYLPLFSILNVAGFSQNKLYVGLHSLSLGCLHHMSLSGETVSYIFVTSDRVIMQSCRHQYMLIPTWHSFLHFTVFLMAEFICRLILK